MCVCVKACPKGYASLIFSTVPVSYCREGSHGIPSLINSAYLRSDACEIVELFMVHTLCCCLESLQFMFASLCTDLPLGKLAVHVHQCLH